MNIRYRTRGPETPVRSALAAWAPVLAIVGISAALAVMGDAGRGLARYDRSGVDAGELWRLVSGHLVHLSPGHLVMNLAALVLIRMLLDGVLTSAEWLASMLAAALAIDLGLYFLETDVGWYVGLSGVLHGLLATGAVVLLRPMPTLGAVLGAGLIVKLAWEQIVGPLPFSESTAGGPVIIAAHLYGAVGGAAYGLALWFVRGRRAASL